MSKALPTPPAAIGCPKCGVQMPCYDPARSGFFGCPNCFAWFAGTATAAEPAPVGTLLDGFRQRVGPQPAMPLGAVAEVGGYRCRVTGYQVRGEKNDAEAEWGEYQLSPAAPGAGSPPANFPLQLVEFEGEWLLVRRAPITPSATHRNGYAAATWQHPDTEQDFEPWHQYAPVIRFAQGEFDWNILDDEGLFIEEFNNRSARPPYQLVRQHGPDTAPEYYLSERLEAAEVAQAFNITLDVPLPDDEELDEEPAAPEPQQLAPPATPGQAQPTPPRPKQAKSNQARQAKAVRAEQRRLRGLLSKLLWAVLGLLAATQLLALMLRPPREVLQSEYTVEQPGTAGTSKMLTSPPFALDGPTAVELSLSVSGLSNHWLEVPGSLVNEQTGQGYEFVSTLEEYHGVEDGESWSEGSTATKALLHRLPAGRYHLNLYPTLDAGAGPVVLAVQAEQHPPLWSNLWLAVLFLYLSGALIKYQYGTDE